MKLGFPRLFRCMVMVACIASVVHLRHNALAQGPLAATIDSLIERDLDPLISAKEQDGLLLRRLSLDLRMVIPTQSELDEFLADQSADRWPKWVQRFLDDPLFRERMVDWLDKTLMQRRPNTHVDRAKWLAFLRQVVDERKPLDAILKESLSSTWWNDSQRAQQRFFVDRGGDPHLIARDIGRIYFGRDMQCAQCHDHPQVNDYLQIDYHGILAFVSPSSLVEAKTKDEKGAEKKLQLYVERAPGDAPFESVFDKGVLFRSGTRVVGGAEQFEPYQFPDERYAAASMQDSFEGAPRPPAVSRRNSLVSQLSMPNQAFADNWSNRVWAMMFGRGLVHPLDMHHADNPPSNPKLLQALSDSLVASGYNVRALIEQIAISQAYQRGSQLPIESSLTNGAVLRLPNEAMQSLATETATRMQTLEANIGTYTRQAEKAKKEMDEAESAWRAAQKERVVLRAELDKAETAFNDIKKKLDEANVALSKVVKQRDDLNARIVLLNEAASKLEQAKALGATDDAELTQTIASTKAKVESTQGTLPAVEKTVGDATAARDAQSVALEAERTKTNEIVARLRPAEASLNQADTVFVSKRAQWRQAESEQVAMLEKMDAIHRLQNWISHSQNVIQNESEQLLAIQTRDQQKSIVESYAIAMTDIKQKTDQVRAELDKNATKIGESKGKLAKVETEISLLQQTLNSLESANSLVESPDSIAQAKQTLQASVNARVTAMGGILSEITGIEQERVVLATQLTAFDSEMADADKRMLIAKGLLEQSQRSVDEKALSIQQSIDACVADMQSVLEDRQKYLYAASVRALSPEQLGWSILQATNVLPNYVAAELAEIEKQSPMPADATPDQRMARKVQATRQAVDKLRGNVDVFAGLYSSGVGQTSDEFFASPDQALYMSNGGAVFQWAAPNSNNITSALTQQPDGGAAVDMLYRALLSRAPSQQERQWVSEQLAAGADKKPAIAHELVWGLLSSSEFRVYP